MHIETDASGKIRMTFNNETGAGTIDCYEVFPGIFISCSAFKLEKCESIYAQDSGMFSLIPDCYHCDLKGYMTIDGKIPENEKAIGMFHTIGSVF